MYKDAIAALMQDELSDEEFDERVRDIIGTVQTEPEAPAGDEVEVTNPQPDMLASLNEAIKTLNEKYDMMAEKFAKLVVPEPVGAPEPTPPTTAVQEYEEIIK